MDRKRSYVRAYDDPADLAKPRGKQDWQLEPHSIWYPTNDRHLADGMDGDACLQPISAMFATRPLSSAGRSGLKRGCSGNAATGFA